MKLLLIVLGLTLAGAQPISDSERTAFDNELQMRTRYNEMIVALQDFGKASDAFCVIVNSGTMWPLKESRTLEIKADALIKAWHRMQASDGWISTRKVR